MDTSRDESLDRRDTTEVAVLLQPLSLDNPQIASFLRPSAPLNKDAFH